MNTERLPTTKRLLAQGLLKMIANALRKDLVDEDLRIFEDWEDTWSLRFNSEKCKTLHLARNENPGTGIRLTKWPNERQVSLNYAQKTLF